MPFCSFRLSARKPRDPAYPKELKTLGDHLRKRRLDLGMQQKGVSLHLGVDTASVVHWELGWHEPRLHHLPNIIQFLGYDPRPEGKMFGERLRRRRTAAGITQKQLARRVRVDPTTVARWERGEGRPSERSLRQVESLLGWRGHSPR